MMLLQGSSASRLSRRPMGLASSDPLRSSGAMPCEMEEGLGNMSF